MPVRLSSVLDVKHSALEEQGVFDSYIDLDSGFYIDPFLLREAQQSIAELVGAYDYFWAYFQHILYDLSDLHNTEGNGFSNIVKRLTFPELSQLRLGYALEDNAGKGIGNTKAKKMAKAAYRLVKLNIYDPVIFELMEILQDGIGPDLISDMTASIILKYLAVFSRRVSIQLRLRTKTENIQDRSYILPCYRYGYKAEDKAVILVPKALLRQLPVALDWSNFGYGKQLKSRINNQYKQHWQQFIKSTNSIQKREMIAFLENNESELEDFINTYKSKIGISYNFDSDPNGEFIWEEVAKKYGKPQSSKGVSFQTSLDELFDYFQTVLIKKEFRPYIINIVENESVFRPQKAIGLLFYGIAEIWFKNLYQVRLIQQKDRVRINVVSYEGVLLGYIYVFYTSHSSFLAKYEELSNKGEPFYHFYHFLLIQEQQNNTNVQKLKDLISSGKCRDNCEYKYINLYENIHNLPSDK